MKSYCVVSHFSRSNDNFLLFFLHIYVTVYNCIAKLLTSATSLYTCMLNAVLIAVHLVDAGHFRGC